MLDRIAYKLRHEQTDKVIFDIYGCFMLLQRFLDLHLTLDRCGWFCSGGLESLLISHHLNRLTCSAKQGITHPFCWIRGVTPNLPGVEARIFAGTDRAGLQGIHWLCACVCACVCVWGDSPSNWCSSNLPCVCDIADMYLQVGLKIIRLYKLWSSNIFEM